MPLLKGGGVIGKDARNRLMSGKLDKAQSGLDALIHQVEPAKLKKLAEAKTTTARDLLNLANSCSPPMAFSSSFRVDSTRPPRASSTENGKGKASGKGNNKDFDKAKGMDFGKGHGKGGGVTTPVSIDAAGLGNVHVLPSLKRTGGPCAAGVFLAATKAAEDIVRELQADPWPAPLAILVMGNLKTIAAHWQDSQLLAKGIEVAVPTCQGARKLVRKMVAFQVGSAALTLPSPAVFDLEDEFESYQTWNMQVRQLWAPAEIWQACCAPQPAKPSATGRKISAASYLSELLKTLLLAKLKLTECTDVEAWSGRKHGDADGHAGCIDSLIRIPRQYEEALRRASGHDGIFFERKFVSEEAKEAERAVRPLIAVPGEGWDLDKILVTLRDTEGAEGFEVWGKRLMLRVQIDHEPAARFKLTGKEHAPTDLLWRMSGVPHIKLAQLADFLKDRLLWDIEEIISFRKKDAVIRAASAPPTEYQCGGQDFWSIIMGSEVVTIRQIVPRHRRQDKGPVVDINFAATSRPTPKDWSKLLTPVPHPPSMGVDDAEDPDLEEPQGDATNTPGALGQFLRSHVATELTESAQLQLRQVIEKSAEDSAAQQRWIEQAVDNKLAIFQQALVDQQATWEKVQDRKLQDLQASQKEFQDLTQQEFQNVHDTAATRHRDLMNQMTSMMAVLQAHGPSGEKRPGDFPEQAVAKAKAMPSDSGNATIEIVDAVDEKCFDKARCEVLPPGLEAPLYSESASLPHAITCGLLVQGDGNRHTADVLRGQGRRSSTGSSPSLKTLTSRSWVPTCEATIRLGPGPRPSSMDSCGGLCNAAASSGTLEAKDEPCFDRAMCDVVPPGPDVFSYSNSATSPLDVTACGLCVQDVGTQMVPTTLYRHMVLFMQIWGFATLFGTVVCVFSSAEASSGFRECGLFSAAWRWLARHAGYLLFLGLFVFDAALLAAQPVNWQVSFLGIRLGEAAVPGHRRRAAKGYNLAKTVHNLRLRSHNMGGLRSWDKKTQLWCEDAVDVHAIQETWADAKDILDARRHFAKQGLRSFWSAPGPTRGCGSGTLVTVSRPAVEKDHLWNTTRAAGAWIETTQVDNGFAVLSFYGIAGSNACNTKRLETERLLIALLSHLGAYRHRPIFLCMDSNLSYEKSDTMQALTKLGWTDLAAGLGGTFKAKPTDANPCSRIDFVFANPAAAGLVLDVQLRWLPGFQHAALDIDLHLGLDTGPISRLRAPKRMPRVPTLSQCDLDTYEEWANDTWQNTFASGFKVALEQKDTASAWQLCEAFDSECLKMRLDLAGI
ncbi:unnamed protein product [Symbiodinium sp. CCMP2456]|nr:unnamed protein product [Symbiodinium sp. CCMP2456]